MFVRDYCGVCLYMWLCVHLSFCMQCVCAYVFGCCVSYVQYCECVRVCLLCLSVNVFIMYFTQNWRKLNKLGDGLWPEERSDHASCCLNYGQQFPQLLVSGGLDRQNKPLADLWIRRKVRQRFHHFLPCVWFVYHKAQ